MKKFLAFLALIGASLGLSAQTGLATYNQFSPSWFAPGGKYSAVDAQSGASYTAALIDANNLITMSNGSANTLTVPANASVAFPIGSRLSIQQIGAGLTTVSPAGGVTFTSAAGTTITTGAQYGRVSLRKTALNTWTLDSASPGGAAGSNTQVQYNASGVLGASSNFTWNSSSSLLNLGATLTPGTFSVGTLAAMTISGVALAVPSFASNSNIQGNVEIHSYTSSSPAAGAFAYGVRARGTISSPAAVASGDNLLTLGGAGFDGTNYTWGAHIHFLADGTPSAGVLPGALDFQTTPSGSNTPVSVLKLDHAGAFWVNGSTGTAGQILTSGGAGAAASWASAGAAPAATDVQVFLTSGTWTRPSAAKSVEVITVGAGGGGGGGARVGAASAKGGGGGGGGGGYLTRTLNPSNLAATVAVTVGTGGTSGAGSVAIGNGSNGGNGSDSTFGAYLTAKGGSFGTGATSAGGAAGAGGALVVGATPYSTAGSAGATGAFGNTGVAATSVTAAFYAAPGGGGGGGATGANAIVASSAGGDSGAGETVGAAGTGSAGSANPGGDGAFSTGSFWPGSGAGGGGATATGGSGGAGGTGKHGSGGGGGGGGFAAGGNGGVGGDGYVIVITYF